MKEAEQGWQKANDKIGERAGLNITAALDDLKEVQPQLVLQLKKSGKSRQARKTYKISVAGVQRHRSAADVRRDCECDLRRFIIGERVHDLPVVGVDVRERLTVRVLDDETARDSLNCPRWWKAAAHLPVI